MSTNDRFEQPLCFSAMAGRFPGAPSIDALWQRILEAQPAPLTDMPARWGIARDAIVAPDPGTANRIYLDRAFCLPEESLDGRPFPWGHQMSVTRATLLELLEQAGTVERDSLGLVMGTSWSDESYFVADAGSAHAGRQPGVDGIGPSRQAEELARTLGIEGPVLATDTACSSFAYALELGVGLIRSGQARRVIVAGVNAFLPPSLFLGFSQLRALAADGVLRAFGQDAGGIVPGECVAAFLLEAQQDAVDAGRTPLGALRGIGISSDGAEGSVFAPGKQAQLTAYGRAYEGLDPASIDYLEAHGTGTPLGDGTELDSLDAFFRQHVGGRRLPVGSVKTLIGHTLAAAGAASLAKALLMLRHRTIPPHIGCAPHGRLSDSCLALQREAATIGEREQPLRIGISSFGFGGANAHVVVEESRPLATGAPAAQRARVQQLDLAIVDVEAAFGDAASTHAFQRKLGEAPACAPFPPRFAGFAPQAPVTGQFLAGQREIDITGYRMGPRPLGRIDPFKLLIAHRANMLVKRHSGIAGAPDTALVVCANMGGEGFFTSYRSITRHYYDDPAFPAPDLAVDDVATMLPTMNSGYAAQFLNLRGFHQTLSGAPGMFFHTLLAAPTWLDKRCRTLLLGAGRYLGCSADVALAAHQGGRHGEGFGLLALKSAASAQADGDAPLAIIRSAVSAASLDEARALAGVADGAVEVCELDAADSGAQAHTGYLAEASGIEAVLAALLRAQPASVIEVRRAGAPVLWLFIEHLRRAAPAPDPAPARPFALTFSAPVPVAQLEPAAPSATLLAGPAPGVEDGFEHITRTLMTSLRLRTRALELLGAQLCRAPAAEPLALSRRDARNIVLRDPVASGGELCASLVVDESHPYFFDHPLDHVPGILLLAGVLQLTELAMARSGMRAMFVSSLDVRFKRYTEKDKPITLVLTGGATPAQFKVKCMQGGQLMCECTLGASPVPAGAARAPSRPRPQGLPQARLLHKANADNVLVAALGESGDAVHADTLPVPPRHFFSDDGGEHHSLLYFLEVARQCFMLIAHTKLDIPTGVPMNLVELRFTLDAPIPRHRTLRLLPSWQSGQWTGLMQTGRVRMGLMDGDTALGQAAIVAQVVDRELYTLQRHPAVAG